MALRKTIRRDVIIAQLNKSMRKDLTDEEKEAVATFAELILQAGNSYDGYNILEPGGDFNQRHYT